MSLALKSGNFLSLKDRNIPSDPDQMGQQDLTDMVSGALRRAYASSTSAIKEIARAANANERAAKGWLQGKACPSGLYLLRLMKNVPELRAEVRRLTIMEAEIDPEFDRAFNAAASLFAKLQSGRGGGGA